MRIAMITHGTRGDAQPMIVLGSELRRRGHDVVMGFPPNLMGFARQCNFPVHPVGVDSQKFLDSPEGQSWLASGNVKAFMDALGKVARENSDSFNKGCIDTCEGVDLIVTGILTEDRAVSFGEARNIPVVHLHSAPFRPTRAYPNYLATVRSLPAPVNVATGHLVDRLFWRSNHDDLNQFRVELGLAPVNTSTAKRVKQGGRTELQAYSAVLAPGITDYGRTRPIIGFLTPRPEERTLFGETGIATDVDTWLSSGEPPVYVGFGSMPVSNPRATLAMVQRVVARLGLRALVSAGWSQLQDFEDPGEQIRLVGAINHDAVFPRCRVAVHHGGAGTTAASISAGTPTMVCSVFADQPFWGERLKQLGAGSHVPYASLTEESFERGLRKALESDSARRASELSTALRSESNAADVAADIVEVAGRN